jgi:hypothetical protein
LTQQNENSTTEAREAESARAGAPEIEITPAMIEAGVYAARECWLGEPLSEVVRKVYLAMALER